MEIEDLRRNYDQGTLTPDALNANPFRQFELWFELAKTTPAPDWLEVNAMTLATSDPTGHATARIVLLKDLSDSGFAFFTNYDSDKARQLAVNPQASLLFYWPHVEKQVRIEGTVQRTSSEVSDKYFHARPRGSQLSAVVSRQSRPLDDRSSLEEQTRELEKRYLNQEIPRPEYWGGYSLSPTSWEFWQGRPNRLHDRFTYKSLPAGNWEVTRLAP